MPNDSPDVPCAEIGAGTPISAHERVAHALAEAEATLAAAGVPSPRFDAEELAAHVLGVTRSRMSRHAALGVDAAARLRGLVARRAAREPLQHLLGTAVLGPVEVAVGPGVFVPRFETELLLEWGLRAVSGVAEPLVVDLCTGTGALALAVAVSRPDAEVHAVEKDPDALGWARRNLGDRGDDGRDGHGRDRHPRDRGGPDAGVRQGGQERSVRDGGRVVLHAADVRAPDLLAPLAGRVDLLLANPPYVPDGTPVPPEVGRWDPPGAVFGGPDGLEIVRAVADAAVRLLRPGGALAVEHDDSHGDAAPEILRRRGFAQVEEHADLAGRPRFVTARRA